MSTEEGVQQLWYASLAWKRVPGYVEGHTCETLFKILRPLEIAKTSTGALPRQAEELAHMIVHNKIRRKKRKGSNNIVDLNSRRKIVGQESKAA